MEITDEQIERILNVSREKNGYAYTIEWLRKQIRDILKPVEPEGKPMLEWKDGPPTEPGIYIIDCSKTDGFGCEYYEQFVIDGWNDPESKGHITRHYGPIPEPTKPLPDKPMLFKCRYKKDGCLGVGRFYPGSDYPFAIMFATGATTTLYKLYEWDTFIEITEWIDE